METKNCPFCNKKVLAIANVCKHCRQPFDSFQNLEIEAIESEQAVEVLAQEQSEPIPTGNNSYSRVQSRYGEEDKMGYLMWGLCILLPSLVGIIAIIFYLVKNQYGKAKSAFFATLIGVALMWILNHLNSF